MLQPPNPINRSFVWFLLICSLLWGGVTAVVLTLDIVVDESRKMADRMARSPTRLCSRDGKLCYCGRLEYDFLVFLPCLLLFLFYSVLIPVCFSYVSLFSVASSVQQPSVPLQQVRVLLAAFFLCSRVICILSHLRIPLVLFLFIFRSSDITLVGVSAVLSYPVRWHVIRQP